MASCWGELLVQGHRRDGAVGGEEQAKGRDDEDICAD
jgi:hypothetical protein